MVKHVILWTLKSELSDAEKAEVKAGIKEGLEGLTNMLDDEDIRMILSGQRDIVEIAEELIKAANNNGGKDNIAVVIVEPFATK